MKTADNNGEIRLDEREVLPNKICETLKAKGIKPDSVVNQQLVIWLDCAEMAVYGNYDCKDCCDSIRAYLNDNGGYVFEQVVFKQGKPEENVGATRIGDNDREWFTTERYQHPEDVPIQAYICAGENFKLEQDRYILSSRELEQNGNPYYNIGRGRFVDQESLRARINQIVFDENHGNNEIISRGFAHIGFLKSEKCFYFEPEEGINNEDRSVGVLRNGVVSYSHNIQLQNGDRIVVTISVNGRPMTRTILIYSDNRVVDSPTAITRITGPEVFKKLKKEFKEWMKSESFGKTLIYPVSIYVYMNWRDFQENRDRIRMWVPPIVSELYRVIKWRIRSLEFGPRMGHRACELMRRFGAWIGKKTYVSEEFKPSVIYLPYNKKWFFQFISCEIGPDNRPILPGNVVFHFGCAVPNDGDVIPSEPRIYMEGIPTKVEKGKKVDVGAAELSAIKVADQLAYFVPFDEQLRTNEKQIQDALANYKDGKKIYATITMTERNKEYSWEMLCNRISVSGSNDTRNQIDVIKLPNPNVQDNHVLIQYLEKEKKFEVATWGETTLNGVEMTKSTGTIPEWVALPDGSRLILNNDIDIQFKANYK